MPSPSPVRVVQLSMTPVKGTRLLHPRTLQLEAGGVRGDRLFHVIDERDRMLNGKQSGELSTVAAEYDGDLGVLSLQFPGGSQATGEVELGAPLQAGFYSRKASVRPVIGPFSSALSAHLGRPVRLVRAGLEGGIDRGKAGGVSIVSQASVERLAQQADVRSVDSRRFRMSVEVSGMGANEEDAWVGHRLSIGAAVVAVRGHVGRCLVTSRNPDTGEVDLATLDLLGDYRREAHTTEPLALGVFGEVIEPASIAVGDLLTLL